MNKVPLLVASTLLLPFMTGDGVKNVNRLQNIPKSSVLVENNQKLVDPYTRYIPYEKTISLELPSNAELKALDDMFEKTYKDGNLPELNGQWLNSEPMKLHDFKGKTIVLDFWATWCEACRKHMPEYEKIWREYKNEVQVIGVHSPKGADINRIKKYISENNITFPILIGDVQTYQNWSVRYIPTQRVIGTDEKAKNGNYLLDLIKSR
jgi:thiol-disulfide isomerase/thioredoxin